MIDVYFWPTPNGWKITIMLEELGLPYNIFAPPRDEYREAGEGIGEQKNQWRQKAN